MVSPRIVGLGALNGVVEDAQALGWKPGFGSGGGTIVQQAMAFLQQYYAMHPPAAAPAPVPQPAAAPTPVAFQPAPVQTAQYLTVRADTPQSAPIQPSAFPQDSAGFLPGGVDYGGLSPHEIGQESPAASSSGNGVWLAVVAALMMVAGG